MWTRSTWHECADELNQVCAKFRRAYWGGRTGGKGWPRHPDDTKEMESTSRDGIQLLRSLALAIRSEQDFSLTSNGQITVGAFKPSNASPKDSTSIKQEGGYETLVRISEWHPLGLRQALNKIAHANPSVADYYIAPSNSAHDLILFGEDRGSSWAAVISIFRLCEAVRALPDATVNTGEAHREA